jgi:hypothetical protein
MVLDAKRETLKTKMAELDEESAKEQQRVIDPATVSAETFNTSRRYSIVFPLKDKGIYCNCSSRKSCITKTLQS